MGIGPSLVPDQSTAEEALAPARAMAGELGEDVAPLAREMAAQLMTNIPELGSGEEVYEEVLASCEANLSAIFWMLRQGIPAERTEAPVLALALAHGTVRRGGELSAILRAYRFGQAIFSSWWIDRLTQRVDDPRALAQAVDHSLTFVFSYLDAVVLRVTEEYTRERERWVRSSAALRADTVGAILAGEAIDVDAASGRLGYELRRQHLGIVLWTEPSTEGDDTFHRLEAAAVKLAEGLGCRRPLLVPAGQTLLWGWINAHDPASPSALADAHAALRKGGEGLWVVAGEWSEGVEGVRRTHEDAMQARRVARDGRQPAGTLTSYRDVAVASLLGADLTRARRFVATALGPLAAPGEPMARLRETLAAFLEGGSSHVAAARRLHVHQNTVAYRVRRAEELLEVPIADHRLELELALALAATLGDAVLRPEA
jgi:DNA-binding PucR family transcriptional regulator